MPTFPILPSLARRPASALMISAAIALSGCGGGGGDDPPDNGSGGTPLPVSIDTLAGDWVQKGCVKAGAQSFKKTLRARITGPATLDYAEGVLVFNGNACAGAPQQSGPSRLGAVNFARSEANQGLAAHWGVLDTVTGTRFGAIWTLQPTPLLCLLGDEIPSIQPSLAAVSASLATLPEDNCFTQ